MHNLNVRLDRTFLGWNTINLTRKLLLNTLKKVFQSVIWTIRSLVALPILIIFYGAFLLTTCVYIFSILFASVIRIVEPTNDFIDLQLARSTKPSIEKIKKSSIHLENEYFSTKSYKPPFQKHFF